MKESILTTMNDNNYSYVDGTSLSAAKVSGVLLDIEKLNCFNNPGLAVIRLALTSPPYSNKNSVPIIDEYEALK